MPFLREQARQTSLHVPRLSPRDAVDQVHEGDEVLPRLMAHMKVVVLLCLLLLLKDLPPRLIAVVGRSKLYLET